MWLVDLGPYTYSDLVPDLDRLAVGWLDVAEPFDTGLVGSELIHHQFVEVLRWAAVNRSIITFRGFHSCNLAGCVHPSDEPDHLSGPTTSYDGSEGRSLGAGRIEVHDGRTTFVAPDLIVHYVTDHGYRPPAAFVRAALVGEWIEPEIYPGFHRRTGDSVPLEDWDTHLSDTFWDALSAQLESTTAEVRNRIEVEVQPTVMTCRYTKKKLPAVTLVYKIDGRPLPFDPRRKWSPTAAGAQAAAARIATKIDNQTAGGRAKRVAQNQAESPKPADRAKGQPG